MCPAIKGLDEVQVFDTDFGRISILICFDLNFSEPWQRAHELNAEILFWPSAYAGGAPLSGMAMVFGYYVVPVGEGNFIDMTGQTLTAVESPRDRQFIATIDLDRTFVHQDFNREKIARVLKDHAGEVELDGDHLLEGWYLLRSTKPGVLARDLCRQYEIETLWEYRQRSRSGIDKLRTAHKPV